MGPESGRRAIQEGLKEHAEQLAEKDTIQKEMVARENREKILESALNKYREAISNLPSLDEIKEQIKTLLLKEGIVADSDGSLRLLDAKGREQESADEIIDELSADMQSQKESDAFWKLKDQLSDNEFRYLYNDLRDDRGFMPVTVYRKIHWEPSKLEKFTHAKKIVVQMYKE